MLGVGAGVGLKNDVDISKMLKYLCDGQDANYPIREQVLLHWGTTFVTFFFP